MTETPHNDTHNGAPVPKTRRCPQCGRVLPLTPQWWYRNGRNHTGFAGWCKDCYRRWRKEGSRPRVRRPKPPKADSKKRRWTAEEERVLRDEYPIKSTAEMATKLRRSQLAIRLRAHELGLLKVQPRAKRPDVWAKASEIAGEYRAGMTLAALAHYYRTTDETIHSVLVEQGCATRDSRRQSRERRRYVNGDLQVQCTRCGRWLPRTDEFFGPDTSSPEGLRARCRRCVREAMREFYAAHPDKQEERLQRTREHHRRLRHGLWAARWRFAAEQLSDWEEGNDD